MKILRPRNKVNFVDQNNVFVGYDEDSCCCERVGWFISQNESNSLGEVNLDGDFEDYSFDTSYFEEVDCPEINDSGGMVRFKLQNLEGQEIFLHLYNSHNGYYGHGFTATINGIHWQEDTL